ncbi:MAG TPA: alpha/beta hydrolase [Terriglobales bacterium]|nr:alpha/beta hydrolase [Terriglobales bacterium]
MIKRFLLWSAGILIVLIVIAILAFRLSPWPSVVLIRHVFSNGDRASEAALEKHVPAGIVTRRDLAYGDGKDEVFDLYYPEGTNAPRPTIVWVHGGGFVAGNKNGIANYMKILAGRGYTMVAVEYSKAPGATYPKPVEQVNTALGFLVRHAGDFKIDPAMIILAGDSAGAHHASQVALLTTDPHFAHAIRISPQLQPNQLLAVLLLSGAFDPSAVNLEGNFGWFLETVLWAYLGRKNFREQAGFRLMSVTSQVTVAFPPSFISSGNGDPLAPQAVALAQKLAGLGVHIETLFFPTDRVPRLPHEYQFNLDDAAGQEALNRTLAFLGTIPKRTISSNPLPSQVRSDIRGSKKESRRLRSLEPLHTPHFTRSNQREETSGG